MTWLKLYLRWPPFYRETNLKIIPVWNSSSERHNRQKGNKMALLKYGATVLPFNSRRHCWWLGQLWWWRWRVRQQTFKAFRALWCCFFFCSVNAVTMTLCFWNVSQKHTHADTSSRHCYTYILQKKKKKKFILITYLTGTTERVFGLKAPQMGTSVFVCVCVRAHSCGRAARTGNFLCWGRGEKLGHFIFSSVHCQKGQRSKVRAIGEFCAACRQIRFQERGRNANHPGGIGAWMSVLVCIRKYTHTHASVCMCVCVCPAHMCKWTCFYVGLCREKKKKKKSQCQWYFLLIWAFIYICSKMLPMDLKYLVSAGVWKRTKR